MRKNQVNRAIIAARISDRPAETPSRSVGTNPGARTSTIVTATGHVKRTTCAPLTAMQRDSEGNRSAWSASPYFFTDPLWSQTVGNQSDAGRNRQGVKR